MNPRFLYLNSRDDFYRIDISKIAYFESDGNYTTFILTNGQKGTMGVNLAQMQQNLTASLGDDARNFARIGKRFIVNLNYVYRINVIKQQLSISDGNKFSFNLPVSKDALRKLREIYVNNYLTQKQTT